MHPILPHLHRVYRQVGSISPPPVDAPPAVHAAHLNYLSQLNDSAGAFLKHVLDRMVDAEIEPIMEDSSAAFPLFLK